MKALYFLKFWRPTTTHKDNQPCSGNSDTTEISNTMVDIDDEFEEGEESFFELELTVPDFDNIKINSNSNNNNKNEHPIDTESNIFDLNAKMLHNSANKADNSKHKFPQPTFSLSPTDVLSKRKILPIEPILKPQSPISLLKTSAPRFRVLMFKKSKSMASHKKEKTGETEFGGVFLDTTTPKHKNRESKLFTVKFKLEEATNLSMFTRVNSLKSRMLDDSSSLSDDSSKRFSKETIQKYLKLIKPLYIKVSKKQSDKMKFSDELSVAASPSCYPVALPASSPPKKEKPGSIPSGIREVCKHLGKSKSASVTNGISLPTMNRRDDSLLLQHDGIQSAILHCKQSFNSSRGSSLLSRFANDPLPEKPMDSPRISSEDNGIH